MTAKKTVPSATQTKPISLADALSMETADSHPGISCGVRRVAEGLDGPNLDFFIKAVKDLSIPATYINRALTRLDPPVKISKEAVSRHRRKDCSCP